MPLWKLTLAYDGTPFHGWQTQPGLATVQGTLADALASVTGERVLPQGSGRTDTGVHALGQVASVALARPIPADRLARALNHVLPSAIRVISAEPAAGNFHARHSALRKTYAYRILPRPLMGLEPICSPFLAPYVWPCPWPFTLDAANRAAAAVLGEHDFSSFAASDPDRREREADPDDTLCSAVRTIFRSQWTAESEAGERLFVYRVTGSGFLHHMVRNLVGTQVDEAAGRLGGSTIESVLAARKRSAAGPTAPARGLYLVDVEYPAGAGGER